MRRLHLPVLLLIILILPWQFSLCQNVKSLPIPSWVQNVDYSTTNADTVHAGGFYYLLLESQFNISDQRSFYRTSLKILNHKGLESASAISVNYDPSYENLVFHTLKVIRGSKIINKLLKSKFEIIRREQNIDRSVYDKSLDAILNLDDIQVGDVIEYSYSLTGYNPIFENKFFTTLSLNYSVPVGKRFIRILSPSEKKLIFKKFNNAQEPIKSQSKNSTAYTLEANSVPAYLMEDKTPSWFDPYDRIEVSEYETWRDVITWALPLYSTKSFSSKEIDKKLAEIKQNNKSLESQISSSIQFVQDEIRYLAFLDGIGGYKPHAPSIVFKQRFGDCKDKSLLLSYMLQQLGVESYPALVNTENGYVLDNQLPSPGSFDHCIVYLSLNDSALWIDPTITLERGTLKLKQTPDYYHALVLSGKENSLRELKPPSYQTNRIVVHEDFTLKMVGGSANLKVMSEYAGSEADYMRSYWKSNGIQEVNKSYTDFYSNDYAEIQIEKNVAFVDDEGQNILKTEEDYFVENFWVYDSATKKYSAELYPRIVANYMTAPTSKTRKMPYKLAYPVNVSQIITLHLPETWNITESSKKVSSKGFEYTSSISKIDDKTATLHYTFKSLRSYLDAGDVKNHLRQIDIALEDLSFNLSYANGVDKTAPIAGIFNVPFLLISLFAVIIIFLGLRKLNLYDPRSKNYEFAHDQVGGWMVLPLIGVSISPFVVAFRLYQDGYFNYVHWRVLTDPSYELYSPALGSITLMELLYNLLKIGYSFLLMRQILQKRTSLPLLICIFYAANLVFNLTESICLHVIDLPKNYEMPSMQTQIIGAIAGASIWIPYFLSSERVKGTFTNRLET